MRVELDMPIFDSVRSDPVDRMAIDEEADGNQNAVDRNRVSGAQPQFAARLIYGEGARGDANRLHRFRVRVASAIDRAMADPDNRPRSRRGHDPVANLQLLDRDLAAQRANARSPRETRDVDIRSRYGVGASGEGAKARSDEIQLLLETAAVDGTVDRDHGKRAFNLLVGDGRVGEIGDIHLVGRGGPGDVAGEQVGCLQRRSAVERHRVAVPAVRSSSNRRSA